jgi:transcriptional regulator with XRE-family HTH domain
LIEKAIRFRREKRISKAELLKLTGLSRRAIFRIEKNGISCEVNRFY